MRSSTAIKHGSPVLASGLGGRTNETSVKNASRTALEGQFESIIETNRAALGRLAASYASNTADRHDLFQEICIALWRALPGFRGECSERTFLFRIAHNRCITHSTRRRPTISLEDVHADPEDPAETAEGLVAAEQQHRRLHHAVRRLPLIYREVTVLALEGMQYREIADIVGISETNVGVRLNRAREKLQAMLEDIR